MGKTSSSEIFLLVIIVVFIVIIVLIAVVLITIYLTINYYIDSYTRDLQNYCSSLELIVYTNKVERPAKNGVYEQSLTKALIEVSLNTSNANCTNVLPLENPIGYNKQIYLQGINPINGELTFFAYIFWNVETCSAIFSFTGTSSVSEWIADFQYTLVPADKLNGYQNGVMCHKGFYDIYLSVRDKLWKWYRKNRTWLKNLFITGHSLGGALSTICSFDFADDKGDLTHYSFAAPRSGNILYSQIFEQRIPTSLRINNTEDIITDMPPATWNGNTYQHTIGSIPFTVSLGSLVKNHVSAYLDYVPECPVVGESKCDK